jgi:hypothetical protein
MKKLLFLALFILASYITVCGQDSYYMDKDYAVFQRHPKAKGLDFKIKVPSGWILEEGTRPNVVCKLTQGNSSFMIIVRHNLTFLSRKQAKVFLDSEELAEGYLESSERMVDQKIVSVSNTIVDTYPAKLFEMQYKMHIPMVNKMYDFHSYFWTVCYEDLLILIQATALQKDFQSLSFRFHDILQNIVLLEHYE